MTQISHVLLFWFVETPVQPLQISLFHKNHPKTKNRKKQNKQKQNMALFWNSAPYQSTKYYMEYFVSRSLTEVGPVVNNVKDKDRYDDDRRQTNFN